MICPKTLIYKLDIEFTFKKNSLQNSHHHTQNQHKNNTNPRK